MHSNHHNQGKVSDKCLSQVPPRLSRALQDRSLYPLCRTVLACPLCQPHRIVQQTNSNKRPRRERSRSLQMLPNLKRMIILSLVETVWKEESHLTERALTVKGTIRGRERWARTTLSPYIFHSIARSITCKCSMKSLVTISLMTDWQSSSTSWMGLVIHLIRKSKIKCRTTLQLCLQVRMVTKTYLRPAPFKAIEPLRQPNVGQLHSSQILM